MQALITVGAFLITLGVLVSFHEFGHFVAARACGVRVLRFAIGFGKPLFTYRAKNKTEWVIASIPLGGYVKLLDGRDQSQHISSDDKKFSFDQKPLWQRSLIVAAGPFANFFLAIVLFTSIYITGVPQLPALLQSPPENSVASKLGVIEGDRVIGWQTLGSEAVPISGVFEPIPSWNAQVGWQPFLAFLALISIGIGMLNLLPFPMLDGGQLLYDAWELVAGKRISASVQEQFQKVGFLLLITLSLLALFNDLQRYLSL